MMQQSPPPMQEIEFEIDRNAVEKYFLARDSLILLVCFGWYFGLGILLAWLHYYKKNKFSRWYCPIRVSNLHYRLEGSLLRADGGVFFLFRKSIPLERITDVALVQGPLLRYFGIWAMNIQTAGSAQCEATLYGVRNPEEVRELILSQRQRINGEKAADA